MVLLKNIGKGILYIIGLPFFLLVLLGTAVVGLIMIIFMFLKSIILFFTGRSLDDDLPEDIKAKAIKEGRNPEEPFMKRNVVQEEHPKTIEEAVFGPETNQVPPIVNQQEVPPSVVQTEAPAFEEEPITPEEEEPVVEEEPMKHDNIVITPEPPKKPKIGTYVPKTGSNRFFSESDEGEEDDDDSGVIVSYGDDDE